MKNTAKKIGKRFYKSLEMVALQEFLRWLNLFEGRDICYADPPDCIVTVNNEKKIWIEFSLVYSDWREKRVKVIETNHYVTSYSTNIVRCQSETILEVIKRIEVKIDNGYKECTEKYGKGILLLNIQDACFKWQRDLKRVVDQDNYKDIDLGCFHSVYLYNFPCIVEKKKSDPVVWTSKVVLGQPHFFLLCGKGLPLKTNPSLKAHSDSESENEGLQ